VAAAVLKDWTVAKVFGDPPPNTNDEVPMVVPPPSWTAAARDPNEVKAPVDGSSEVTVLTEAPDGTNPPRIRSWLWSVVTVSLDSGAASCHGSVPASSEGADVDELVAPPGEAAVVELAVREGVAVPPLERAR
jgi:hypothetical protein